MGAAGASLRVQANAIRQAPAAALAEAGAAVEQIAAQVGGSVAPRGVKAGGGRAALVARSTVTAGTGAATCHVQGEPAYGWAWLTYGTAGHVITPREGGALAGGLRHPVRGPVHHPGAGGRNAWGRVAAEAAEAVPPILERAVSEAVAGG